MAKIRLFSAHYDFNTGFIAKSFIFVGIVLFFVFALFSFFPSLSSGLNNGGATVISEIVPAIAIIFLGVGVLLWFLHRQFSKLSDIADEIEKMTEEE